MVYERFGNQMFGKTHSPLLLAFLFAPLCDLCFFVGTLRFIMKSCHQKKKGMNIEEENNKPRAGLEPATLRLKVSRARPIVPPRHISKCRLIIINIIKIFQDASKDGLRSKYIHSI